MVQRQVKHYGLTRGLVTTPLDDGQEFPGFQEFQNIRVTQGVARRRPGRVILARAGSDNEAIDWNGSSQSASGPIDARVWTLGTKWTIEVLLDPDSVSGTRPVIEAGTTTPSLHLDVSSGNWRLRVWDSGATLTTLNSTESAAASLTHLFITRDGAALSMRVNHGTATTTTMSATNLLRAPVGDLRFCYDGTNRYDGPIDYIRGFNIVRPDIGDGHLRFPDPYACGYVLFDYPMEADSDGIIWDRSRFENHVEATSGTSATTALSLQHAPVQLIEDYVDENEKQRIAVIAGGRVHLEDV
ncbi:MAG: LamG-like jellyroll fold domain-containing protein [Mycobacterium sp.]